MLFSQKIFADLSSLLTFQFDGASSTQRTHADREREPADVTRPCSDIERSPGRAERGLFAERHARCFGKSTLATTLHDGQVRPIASVRPQSQKRDRASRSGIMR
jgi:hypothetical protein